MRGSGRIIKRSRPTSVISRRVLAVGIPLTASQTVCLKASPPTRAVMTYFRHSILNANAIELQQQVSMIGIGCSSDSRYNITMEFKRTELVTTLVSWSRAVH